MTELDLIDNFQNMNISDIGKKITKSNDIDELNNLLNDLTLSEKIPVECKKIIYYWVGLQIDTINKKLIEKEQPPLVNFY